MKYSLLPFSAAFLFVISLPTSAKENFPSAANHQQVVAIAKQSTVMIIESNPNESDGKRGSGVIIQNKGDVYTVITNRHVVCEFNRASDSNCLMPYSYTLMTVDGQKYQFNASAVKNFPNDLDLVIVQFRSNRKYAVGKLSKSENIPIGTQIHTAGYDSTTMQFMNDDGSVMAYRSILTSNSNSYYDKRGYNLLYNAYTNKGMSGSGIWNNEGKLVAIHGLGLRYTLGAFDLTYAQYGFVEDLDTKYGWNKGIPVSTFIRSIRQIDKDIAPTSDTEEIPMLGSEANDSFLEAVSLAITSPSNNTLEISSNKRKSFKYLLDAIKFNSSYSYAYFLKSEFCDQIYNENVSVCDRDVEINKGIYRFRPNSSKDYVIRGMLLKNPQKSLLDFNQAISINPNYYEAYISRAAIKISDDFKDYSGAMADYDRAISIFPKTSMAYSSRALLRSEKLNDLPGALSDCNKAVEVNKNPNDYGIYWSRAIVKEKMKDINGAIYDLRLAVERSYSRVQRDLYTEINRLTSDENIGNEMRNSLADIRGKSVQDLLESANTKAGKRRCSESIADYNSVIEITLNNSHAYFGRANCRSVLAYPSNVVLSDYSKAIQLSPESPGYYFSRAEYRYSQYKQIGYSTFNKKYDSSPLEFEEILYDYKKALSLDLSYSDKYNSAIASMYFDRGDSFVKDPNYQLILNDYNTAIKIYPKKGIFYLYRGRLKRDKLKDKKGAEKDFRQALRVFRSEDDTDSRQHFIEITIKEINAL